MGSVEPMQSADRNQDLIAELLTEALDAMKGEQSEVRQRILQARDLALRSADTVPPDGGKLAPWQMRRIEDFVLHNLSNRLLIEQAAEVVRLTPCYLSRAFKETSGMTYSEYVEKARTDHGKRLLLATDKPISEIALECGLADQSHFTRMFKRTEGMPPAAWRRQFGRVPAGRRIDDAALGPVPLFKGAHARIRGGQFHTGMQD